jgi:hypothetical protein
MFRYKYSRTAENGRGDHRRVKFLCVANPNGCGSISNRGNHSVRVAWRKHLSITEVCVCPRLSPAPAGIAGSLGSTARLPMSRCLTTARTNSSSSFHGTSRPRSCARSGSRSSGLPGNASAIRSSRPRWPRSSIFVRTRRRNATT